MRSLPTNTIALLDYSNKCEWSCEMGRDHLNWVNMKYDYTQRHYDAVKALVVDLDSFF